MMNTISKPRTSNSTIKRLLDCQMLMQPAAGNVIGIKNTASCGQHGHVMLAEVKLE